MNNQLTPEQQLAVAQEVMPLPCPEFAGINWFVESEGCNKGKVIAVIDCRVHQFDPDTNAEQWKALAEWCAIKQITIIKLEDNFFCFSLVNDICRGTHTDCMQAAVLAYLQTQSPEGEDVGNG